MRKRPSSHCTVEARHPHKGVRDEDASRSMHSAGKTSLGKEIWTE